VLPNSNARNSINKAIQDCPASEGIYSLVTYEDVDFILKNNDFELLRENYRVAYGSVTELNDCSVKIVESRFNNEELKKELLNYMLEKYIENKRHYSFASSIFAVLKKVVSKLPSYYQVVLMRLWFKLKY
jgi:hypothetical protein